MAPLLLLPTILLLSSPYVQAQQNITLGSSLTPQGPNSFWLSPSGDFAFGFWPIEGNTSSYLLAVWFNKISDKTVAWHAKTTDPDPALVQVSSGSCLQLTSNGALSLQDPIGTEMALPSGGPSITQQIPSFPVRFSLRERSSTAGSSPQTTPMAGSSLTCKIMVFSFILFLCHPVINMNLIGPCLGTPQIWCSVRLECYISPGMMEDKQKSHQGQ